MRLARTRSRRVRTARTVRLPKAPPAHLSSARAMGDGYHASAKPPMARIAARLSEEQIVALASYLSFLQ